MELKESIILMRDFYVFLPVDEKRLTSMMNVLNLITIITDYIKSDIFSAREDNRLAVRVESPFCLLYDEYQDELTATQQEEVEQVVIRICQSVAMGISKLSRIDNKHQLTKTIVAKIYKRCPTNVSRLIIQLPEPGLRFLACCSLFDEVVANKDFSCAAKLKEAICFIQNGHDYLLADQNRLTSMTNVLKMMLELKKDKIPEKTTSSDRSRIFHLYQETLENQK
jgi:hypothetical protein